MKLLICGSRSFIETPENYAILEKEIHRISEFEGWTSDPSEIISGGASGADKLGERYSRDYGIPLKVFPAKWDIHGKQAGYIRNVQMVDYIKSDGFMIAFWDGKSKGTPHTINYCNHEWVRNETIYI